MPYLAMILRLRARCLKEKMGDLICFEGRSQKSMVEWMVSIPGMRQGGVRMKRRRC